MKLAPGSFLCELGEGEGDDSFKSPSFASPSFASPSFESPSFEPSLEPSLSERPESLSLALPRLPTGSTVAYQCSSCSFVFSESFETGPECCLGKSPREAYLARCAPRSVMKLA